MYTGLGCFENIRTQGIGQYIAIFEQPAPNIYINETLLQRKNNN